MKHRACTATALTALGAVVLTAAAPAGDGPYRVTITDGRVAPAEMAAAVEPVPRIVIGQAGGPYFGLTVDGKRICCTPNQSIWSALRVDGRIVHPGRGPGALGLGPQPLPPGPYGKKRLGSQVEWVADRIHVTQTLEIIASRPRGSSGTAPAPARLDTCRISYLLHNRDDRPHRVDYRTSIDILVGNNDGALYASPSTHPGQILNGVILEGKTLPDYLQVLEQNNLANPGFVATMTFKPGRGIGPSRVVLTQLGAVGAGQNFWDIPAIPAGDSACAIYWDGHELKPGEKRALAWAYGGGVAAEPEHQARVQLGLSGSFEPDKLFSIAATVEDPLPSQALTLELPAGIERVEGRDVQPVPPPGPEGTSLVLWKARVRRPGDYEIRVRSSTGMVHAKLVSIQPRQATAPERSLP